MTEPPPGRPNLVVLYPPQDEHDADQPATRADREEHCPHKRITLHEESRIVQCRDCGRRIDPFDVLVRYSSDWDRIVRWRKEAERRRKLAGERLDELLRLERNARGRVRRLDPKAKLPVLPYGHGGDSSNIIA